MKTSLLAFLSCTNFFANARATEDPYFTTYTHHMEEPDSLEIAVSPVYGNPEGGNPFVGSLMEFEYGAKGWWTTEVYLDGQSTKNESTVFTGYRWENRFRPLLREHWINPVLYFEFEDLNGADKTLKEIVGFDSRFDQIEPNAEVRQEKKREAETKLILSSNFKGWNVAENLIAEKNLAHGPWEFGYALGASRPLALAASPRPCSFCRENLRAGLEIYGGLGEWDNWALHDTSQYLAPIFSWEMTSGAAVRLSPTFGLTHNSHRFLLRFGVTYEVASFGRRVKQLFR